MKLHGGSLMVIANRTISQVIQDDSRPDTTYQSSATMESVKQWKCFQLHRTKKGHVQNLKSPLKRHRSPDFTRVERLRRKRLYHLCRCLPVYHPWNKCPQPVGFSWFFQVYEVYDFYMTSVVKSTSVVKAVLITVQPRESQANGFIVDHWWRCDLTISVAQLDQLVPWRIGWFMGTNYPLVN